MKPTHSAMRRLRAGFAVIATALLVATAWAAPSWPELLNYQGQLTNSSGEPVADGTYSVAFRIYDQGNTLLWNDTVNVDVVKGLFNVVLGASNPIVLGNAVEDDLWLELEVAGDGPMSPRQQLLPAMYAYNAARLGGQPLGTSAYNVVQLDNFGKIPAGLVNGGSVSVPLDLAGSSANYVLRAHNSGSGNALSATTASTSAPAIYADGRYGAVIKTNDNSVGVALSAQGPGSAYASLVDRVNNAQVYGLANSASNLGVLGVNNNGSGTGVAGAGGNIGVSGTGGTYGVYGTSGSYGVYGSSPNSIGVGGNGFYGVYGTANYNSSSSRGVYGTYSGSAAGTGVFGENSSTASQAKGVHGSATAGSGQTYGVFGQTSSSSNNAAGVYGTALSGSGVTYGVQGVNASNVAASAGVYGRSNATTVASYGVYGENSSQQGYGVRGVNTAVSGYPVGIRGEANSGVIYSVGVDGFGYYGIKGEGHFGAHGYTTDSNGAGVYGGSENSSSPGVYAQNTEGGVALFAYGDPTAISATGAVNGILASGSSYGASVRATGGSGYGLYAESPYDAIWAVSTNTAGLGYGIYAQTAGQSGAAAYISANNSLGSSDGVNALAYSASGAAGRFTQYHTSGSTFGVRGQAMSGAAYGGYFLNSANSGNATGLYGEGYSTGVSGTARNGTGVLATGSTGLRASGTTYGGYFTSPGNYALRVEGGYMGINNVMPQSGSYGYYSYNAPSPANGSLGIYVENYCANCVAAQFYNTSGTASTGSTGYALLVGGRARFPNVAGSFTFSSGVTSVVVNNNYCDSIDEVQLTPRSDTLGIRFWVSSITDGSFTVSSSSAPASSMTFSYFIVGD